MNPGTSRTSPAAYPTSRPVLRGRGSSNAFPLPDYRNPAYSFCWDHDSLRLAAPPGEGLEWLGPPAMAAGLTDHRWTMHDC